MVPVVNAKPFHASRIHELKTKKLAVYTGIRILFHTKFFALIANRDGQERANIFLLNQSTALNTQGLNPAVFRQKLTM